MQAEGKVEVKTINDIKYSHAVRVYKNNLQRSKV